MYGTYYDGYITFRQPEHYYLSFTIYAGRVICQTLLQLGNLGIHLWYMANLVLSLLRKSCSLQNII